MLDQGGVVGADMVGLAMGRKKSAGVKERLIRMQRKCDSTGDPEACSEAEELQYQLELAYQEEAGPTGGMGSTSSRGSGGRLTGTSGSRRVTMPTHA